MKIRYILLCLLGFLFIANESQAQTVVQSIINTDQTWKASSSPYYVNGNVVIESGVTVTIEPGVTVKGTGKVTIFVDGELLAEGTASSVITIDSVIFSFSDDAVGYDFDNGTGSNFQYCVFNSTSGGGDKQVDTKGTNLLISNCQFNHCYYCIYGYSLSQDSLYIRVDNSTFNGDKQGYVTYMSGTTFLTLDGVEANHMGGMFLGKNATVTNSRFYDFNYFSGIRLSSVADITFDCNEFVKFRGYMIDISNQFGPANINLVNNTFDSADILLTVAGGLADSILTVEYNNFLSFNDYAVVFGKGGSPGLSNSFNLQNNYWGTTTTADIKAKIWDFDDDITIPLDADVSNPLSSAVSDCDGGNIGSTDRVMSADINLYPNPANETMTVNGIAGSYEVIIYNLQGLVVYQGSHSGLAKINTSDFASGIYMLELLSSEEGMARQKFVVSH